MGCPRTCCSHKQGCIRGMGTCSRPFPSLSFPSAIPRICFLHPEPSGLEQGCRLSPGLGSPCAAFLQFDSFSSFFPTFIPQSIGRERLEIKPHPNTPTKPRETLGKLLFVTDFWLWLSTEQPPPITLPSLVSRSSPSLTIQQKGSLEAKPREKRPIFPIRASPAAAVSIPGAAGPCGSPVPPVRAVLLRVSRYKSPFHAQIPEGK